jgi:hypothetical protein
VQTAAEIRDQARAKIDAATSITSKAADEGRPLTKPERRTVEDLLADVEQLNVKRRVAKDREALTEEIDAMQARLSGPRSSMGGAFVKAIMDAGWHPKERPAVTVAAITALGGTKASTVPGVVDWSRLEPVMVPMGQDQRWLFPNLPTQDPETASAVQDFKQSARTLTGTVKRNLDATSDKATVDITLALVTEALSEFAVTIPDVPNAILESIDLLRGFLDTEGKYQVYSAIDAHIFAQIVAATPAFGTTGTTLIDQIRNGIATMRGTGANPDLLLVNPTTAATLDLSTSGAGTPYLFPTRESGAASPVFGLKVVERTSATGNEPPYLLDSRMLGMMYLTTLRFDADPFTGFRKNLTTLRVEVKGLYHVRNVQGARRIAAT